MKKKKVLILMTILTTSLLSIKNINAYVFNNQRLSNPSRVTISITSAASAYSAMSSYLTWATYSGSPIGFTSSCASCAISMDVNNVDSGTYGTTYYNSSSSSRIVYYRAFINTSLNYQKETVVHEVGHALGLSHTQASNNANSVMRELGFNNKAYPLSDDINGINAKYK